MKEEEEEKADDGRVKRERQSSWLPDMLLIELSLSLSLSTKYTENFTDLAVTLVIIIVVCCPTPSQAVHNPALWVTSLVHVTRTW